VERRRSDLALGLVVSIAAHGAVLAAVGGMLSSRNAAPLSNDPRPPLEVLVVEDQNWRAQLEESQPMRLAQPLEMPKVHQPAVPPDWPELDIAVPLKQSLTQKVPVKRHSFGTPLPDRAQPRELLRPEPLVERMREPQSAAPVPITSASSLLVLFRPELRYPSRPHRRGIEGVARVGMEVDSNGEVTRAWILKSSGNRELDHAALANLRDWRFDPVAVAKAGLVGLFRNDVRFEIH